MDPLTFISNTLMTALLIGFLVKAFREDWDKNKNKYLAAKRARRQF